MGRPPIPVEKHRESARAAIRRALAAGPLTSAEIAAATGYKLSHIKGTIYGFMPEVIRPGRRCPREPAGKYRLRTTD